MPRLRVGTSQAYDEFAFLSTILNLYPLSISQISKSLPSETIFGPHTFLIRYLELVEDKFGLAQRRNVEEMASHSLKRSILEH